MNSACVLILNLNNELDFDKFSKFSKQKLVGAEIVIASKQSHKLSEFTEYVFDTDDNDEVINTLIKKIDTDKLIIVRQFDNNNFTPIASVFVELKKENQICLMSKKSGKIKKFFKNLFTPLIRFLFGYDLLMGSLACIGYGKNCIEVLKQLDNPSLFTKVDKWSGVDIKYIEASQAQRVKFKSKVLKHYIRIFIYSLLFAIPILLWIFVPFFGQSMLLKLVGIFVMAICFSLVCIDILVIIVKHIIGGNTYKVAQIVNEEISQKD